MISERLAVLLYTIPAPIRKPAPNRESRSARAICLAGLDASRMIENYPLTKRRDCRPGAMPGAAQTGQPEGALP
jgi:hypothetical protein